MKFDCVVGNPPYNFPKVDGKSSGNVIWPDFVERSKEVFLKDTGYLVFVHPSLWRKPVDENSDVNVRDYLNSISYLNINSSQKGKKVFDAHTRFDWYLEGGLGISKTLVSDIEDKEQLVDLDEWPFIPNKDYEFIQSLLGGDDTQDVIFDSSYHASRDFVTDEKDNIHKYSVVHSTSKTNKSIKYSSHNDRGHFGISKVIVGESAIGDPIIDMEGEYGMTQGAIGLVVDDKTHAERVARALQSETFQRVLEACQWSGFRIDHRLFESFRDDWYKMVNSS